MRWALERFRPDIMLSTSFGAQAAVSLHLVTQLVAGNSGRARRYRLSLSRDLPFADELTARLKLNLKVYRAPESPAWQEARYGR